MTELLTVREVAAQLRTTAEQVRLLIRAGHISASNISTAHGRPTYRIAPSAVERFRRARKVHFVGWGRND